MFRQLLQGWLKGVKLGEEVGYTIRFEDLSKIVRSLPSLLSSQPLFFLQLDYLYLL